MNKHPTLVHPLLLTVLTVLILSGCASPRPEHERPQAAVTPNGEPLPIRPGPDGCRAALADWFAKADTDHDGILNRAEITADAERWFSLADANQDGEITSDELTAIRLRINPLPPLDEHGKGPRDGGGPDRGRDMPQRGRSQIQIDPVMAADANADFRVTRAEFLASVATRADSAPTLDKVQDSCRSDRD